MISGHGHESASIILLADGATDNDEKAGYALSGDRERKLTGFLPQTLRWGDFWKTALIKERVDLKHPEANYPLLTPAYKEILIEEINTINPFVIVPVSELGFNLLTGLKGIRKYRGSVLPLGGGIGINNHNIKILPILGPDPYLYEDPKFEFISRLDFHKLPKYINGDPIAESGNLWICETYNSLRAFIDRAYPNSPYLVFDIETFANIPTCISLCFDGQESVCVPILDRQIPETERAMMLGLIIKLLASPIPKVNQNIKFDWKKLERIGIHVHNVCGDTMLATSLLYCEFPKNLGFLTSIYTDMPYHKDEGKEFNPHKYDRSKLYMYCAKDSLSTWRVYDQQMIEIKEQGVQKVYDEMIGILPLYKTMEDTGIRIDKTQQKKLLSKYYTLFDIEKLKLKKLCGFPLNPLSSKQCGELIYNELKWRIIQGVKHTKSGNPSTDEESLELLLWGSDCQSNLGRSILRGIVNCRKFHKVIEFLELDTYPDGRFRCEFNLAGSENGRSTAGETSDYYVVYEKRKLKFSNLGHSLQTVGKHGFMVDGIIYGKDIRSIFIPSVGFVFVENDLSQAEASVDAVLADDVDILSVFYGPIGIHRLTGSWVFECEPSEIKKNEIVDGIERYYLAKTIRHAGERNMGATRLMMMIQQEKAFCEKVIFTFHQNQPKIRNVFHREIREAVQSQRLLVAPNGRRRDFFGRINENAINEGISFLPQAIVTDYMKQSLVKTFTECPYARPLSEAHDGFLAEVPREKAEEFGSIFRKNIEVPIDFRTCTLSRDYNLIIPCETSVGENWQDMKEIK